MSDPIPSSSTPSTTVVVDRKQFCRLWTFTYISIGLNVLILVCLLICGIMHHHGKHHHHHGFGGRGGDWGRGGGDREMRGGFHHSGGQGGQQGWGKRDGGFGGDRQGGWSRDRGNDFGGQGGRDRDRGPEMGGPGGSDMMRGGGFGGGMRGGNMTPPDPAKMTDMILGRLSTQLTLTDDEKAKIKPIILDQATQVQKDMEAQRLAREKALADTKAKIKALLTADQQKQLDAIWLPGEKPVDATPAAK